MRRWLALGAVGLAVAWGPFVYSELARRPSKAQSDSPRHIEAASLFDDSTPPTAANERFESKTAAATQPEPEPTPAPAAVPVPTIPVTAAPPEEPVAADTESNDAVNDSLVDPAALPLEFVTAFRAEFDSQTRDAFWASEEEPRFKQHFSAVGVPDGMITEVACRKSVCRAVFGALDLDKEIEQKLYARLRENYGNKLTLDVREIEGGGRAALYILRPGYKLEAQPQLSAAGRR